MSEDQSDKLDEILRLCRAMANQLVEHDVQLKFIRSQVDINGEDTASLGTRIRHIEKAVTDLTTIVERHERRLLSLAEAPRKRAGGGRR